MNDVADIIQKFKKAVQNDVRNKVPKKDRPDYFLLFVDLKKAFDTINRRELIDSLYKKDVNPTIVNAIRVLYSNTRMQTS